MGSVRRRAPRSGDTGFGVDNNAVGFDQAVFERREQPESRAGGVAAGVCQHTAGCNLLTEELRKGVDRVGVQRFVLKFAAVPRGVVGFACQTEVRAEVDERGPFLRAHRRERLR